jgi:hypothetical protein
MVVGRNSQGSTVFSSSAHSCFSGGHQLCFVLSTNGYHHGRAWLSRPNGARFQAASLLDQREVVPCRLLFWAAPGFPSCQEAPPRSGIRRSFNDNTRQLLVVITERCALELKTRRDTKVCMKQRISFFLQLLVF